MMAELQTLQAAATECESDSGEESDVTGGRQNFAVSLPHRTASMSTPSLNLSASSDGTVTRTVSYVGLSQAGSDLFRSMSSLSTIDPGSASVQETPQPAQPCLPEIKVTAVDLYPSLRRDSSPSECPVPAAEATPQILPLSHGEVRASRGARLVLPMRSSPATSRASSDASGGRAPRNNQAIVGDTARRVNLEAGDTTWDIQTPRLGGRFVDRLSTASTSSANSFSSGPTPTSCASPCPETSVFQLADEESAPIPI